MSDREREARDLEAYLLELRDMVENARTMPMSASVLVNRDDAVAIVDDIVQSFPEELRHARWLLKERDEFLGQARREADDIIESARVQAERMVERTEIAREARRTAQKIVDDAQTQARQLVHEAEDYIDQKLAAFEVVLERTIQTVQKGRAAPPGRRSTRSAPRARSRTPKAGVASSSTRTSGSRRAVRDRVVGPPARRTPGSERSNPGDRDIGTRAACYPGAAHAASQRSTSPDSTSPPAAPAARASRPCPDSASTSPIS